MSVKYRPVQWNIKKVVYDVVAVVAAGAYIFLFQSIGRALFTGDQALSSQILAMRAWGSCTFFLLSFILAIGPLARIDRRFAPLLYNRRHLGVLTCLVALGHVREVLGWYYTYGRTDRFAAVLTHDTAFNQATVPFPVFGMIALLIMVAMAVTSHDFWQKFFGARTWKSLHMLVYVAYASLITHVAFGALQNDRHIGFAVVFGTTFAVVALLHVIAARRSNAADRVETRFVELDGVRYIDAGSPDAIKDGRACPVVVPGAERIALVRWDGKLAAVHGVCAHQGGPLYEGRVIDGCLTCPWHGWQYRPADGQAPPPFKELLPTYKLRMKDGRVLVDPRPLPPGTPTEPIELEPAPAPEPREEAA